MQLHCSNQCPQTVLHRIWLQPTGCIAETESSHGRPVCSLPAPEPPGAQLPDGVRPHIQVPGFMIHPLTSPCTGRSGVLWSISWPLLLVQGGQGGGQGEAEGAAAGRRGRGAARGGHEQEETQGRCYKTPVTQLRKEANFLTRPDTAPSLSSSFL